jgi:hypothetical protein
MQGNFREFILARFVATPNCFHWKMENNTEQVAHFVCIHFNHGMTNVERCLES